MTDRDKTILEEPEKMCEYCCNFDKEHIGMDCTALCKLTMTLAYAEDYGGNCMFYNVPKERVIVPPVEVGEEIWVIDREDGEAVDISCVMFLAKSKGCIIATSWINDYNFDETLEYHINETQNNFDTDLKVYPDEDCFLTKEEAEQALAERSGDNA